jgi:hypothetical protein
MIFGKKGTNADNSFVTKIEGTLIEVVNQTKFVGIILDNALSWKQHLTYLSKKVAKSIGILSRARKFLDQSTLKLLYYSFQYPYLTYCNVIWGNAGNNLLWPIFRAQKRAIRIIENIKYRDSTKEAFHRLNLLRLPELYKFSVLLFVYKYKNGLLPDTFNSFFVTNSQIHQYAT